MPTFTPPRPDEIEDSGFVPPSPDEIEQPPPDLSKLKLNPYTKVQMETGMRSPDYDPGDFTVALFHQLPRDVGAGLTKAGKVLAAVPKDVGNRMIVGEPEGYELDENGNRIGWPNLRAAVSGEESPSDRLISQKLGKPANFVNAATTGLIESSPRLAAAIADPALGAVAFGLQPEGLDPVSGGMALVAPVLGRYSGAFFEAVGAQAGVSGEAARALINKTGGAATVAGMFTAPEVAQIAKLPEGPDRDAAVLRLGANASTMLVLGLLGERMKALPDGALKDIARRVAVRQDGRVYSPAEIRDIYTRVNRADATVTPEEQNLVRTINRELESPGEALRKGATITTEEVRGPSKFWESLGIRAGEEGVSAGTSGRQKFTPPKPTDIEPSASQPVESRQIPRTSKGAADDGTPTAAPSPAHEHGLQRTIDELTAPKPELVEETPNIQPPAPTTEQAKPLATVADVLGEKMRVLDQLEAELKTKEAAAAPAAVEKPAGNEPGQDTSHTINNAGEDPNGKNREEQNRIIEARRNRVKRFVENLPDGDYLITLGGEDLPVTVETGKKTGRRNYFHTVAGTDVDLVGELGWGRATLADGTVVWEHGTIRPARKAHPTPISAQDEGRSKATPEILPESKPGTSAAGELPPAATFTPPAPTEIEPRAEPVKRRPEVFLNKPSATPKPQTVAELIDAKPEDVLAVSMSTPDAIKVGAGASPEQIRALKTAEEQLKAEYEKARSGPETMETFEKAHALGHKRQMVSEALDEALGLTARKTEIQNWTEERAAAYQKAAQASPPPADMGSAKQVGAGFVPPKFEIKKPIQGPTGAQIVGYEWRSTMGEKWSEREGGYVEARVSDWDNSEESRGTGRSIVHVFYVKRPGGQITPEGIRSAQNILGISETRLMTIAKKEQAAQAYRAEQDKAEAARIEKNAQTTTEAAARAYRVNNYSPMRSFEENNAIFRESVLFEKGGKFIRRGPHAEPFMLEHGWQKVEDDPVLRAEIEARKTGASNVLVTPQIVPAPRNERRGLLPTSARERYTVLDAVKEHGTIGGPAFDDVVSGLKSGKTASQIASPFGREYDALHPVIEDIAEVVRKRGANPFALKPLRAAYDRAGFGGNRKGVDRTFSSMTAARGQGFVPEGGLPESVDDLITRAWHEARTPAADTPEVRRNKFTNATTSPDDTAGLVEISPKALHRGNVFHVRGPGLSEHPVTVNHLNADGTVDVEMSGGPLQGAHTLYGENLWVMKNRGDANALAEASAREHGVTHVQPATQAEQQQRRADDVRIVLQAEAQLRRRADYPSGVSLRPVGRNARGLEGRASGGSVRAAGGILSPAVHAQLEKLLGVRIIFVETADGKPVPFNGVFPMPGRNVLLVDARADVSPLAVIGHEFTHFIESANPELYQEMMNKLIPLMQNAPEFRAWLERRGYGPEMERNPQRTMQIELAGNFWGDNFAEPSFWEQVAQQEPTLFNRLARALVNWLNKIIAKFKDTKGYESGPFFRDVQKARNVVADILARWAKGDRGMDAENARGAEMSRKEADELFSFDAPESVAGQKARMAAERQRSEAMGQKDKMLERADARLTGADVDTTQEMFGAEVKQDKAGQGSLFSKKEGEPRNLVALHNTSEDKLRHMLKMGGLAVPSVAITRADRGAFESFGDISLVGNPDLVTPSGSTKVLNADAYSPRYPTVHYFPDQKNIADIQALVEPTLKKLPAAHQRSFSKFQLFSESPEKSAREALKDSPEMMLAYLDAKGKLPELTTAEDTRYQQGHDLSAVRELVRYNETEKPQFERWVDDTLDRIGYNEKEKIYSGFTNAGNRRYLAHDLDTVVRIMKKGFRDAEGFNYGVGSVRATVAKQFRTLKSIQESRGAIVTKADMDRLKEEVDKEFMAQHDAAMPSRTGGVNSGFGSLDAFCDDLKAMAEGGAENFRHLREMYPNGEPFPQMREFLDKLRTMPTEYFEAKVKRAVQLHEFSGAVVPEGTSPEIVQALEKRGLEVRTYPKGNAEARRAAVEQVAQERGSLFSKKDQSRQELYDAYLAAHDEFAATLKLKWVRNRPPGMKPDEAHDMIAKAAAKMRIARDELLANRDYIARLMERLHTLAKEGADQALLENIAMELDQANPKFVAKVRAELVAEGVLPDSKPLKLEFGRKLDELTDWLNRNPVDSPAPSLLDRLNLANTARERLQGFKDGVEWIGAKLAVSRKAFLEQYKSPPTDTPFRALFKNWKFNDEWTGQEIEAWRKAFVRQVRDPIRRAAITVWIDAGGDTGLLKMQRDAVPDRFLPVWKAATQLTPSEQSLGRQIINNLARMKDDALNAGLMEHAREEYGMPQVWQRPPELGGPSSFAENAPGGTAGNPAARLDPRNPFFSFRRETASYFEGIMARGIPKSLDAADLISHYNAAFHKSLNSRAFISAARNELAADGLPLVQISGMAQEVPLKQGGRGYVVNSGARPASATTLDGRPYMSVDHWAMKDWKLVFKDQAGKPILVRGDMLVHPDHYDFLKNELGESALREGVTGKLLRPTFALNAYLKASKLAVAGFHLMTIAEHMASHLESPFTRGFKIDLRDPDQALLTRHGLELGMASNHAAFMEGLASHGGLFKQIPGLGPLMGNFSDWMFRDYIPAIMMKVGLHAFQRNLKRYGKELTRDQVAELTATQMNAAGGLLNYRQMGRNKTLMDIGRLTLLAPMFLEARGRVVAQAFKPYHHEQRKLLLVQALALFIMARILNALFNDGDPRWEERNWFRVVAGNRAYGLRTIVGDLFHLINDPNSFASGRLSPITRTVIEAGTGRDLRTGANIDTWFQSKVPRTAEIAVRDLLSWLAPVGVEGVLPGQRAKEVTPASMLLTSIGVGSAKETANMQVYDWARKFNLGLDAHAQQWQQQHDNEIRGESAYRKLDVLLGAGDATSARKEYEMLVRQGHSPQAIGNRFTGMLSRPFTGTNAREEQFLARLNDRQRAVYASAMEERRERVQNFVQMLGQAQSESTNAIR